MGGFLLGLVVAMLINVVTALFSRRHALGLIPWLMLYLALHGGYVLLTNDIVWGHSMSLAERLHSHWSYVAVILIFAIIGGVYWFLVQSATQRLATATIPHEGIGGQHPVNPIPETPKVIQPSVPSTGHTGGKETATKVPATKHLEPSVIFSAYTQPDEPYPEGTLLAGIVWQKQFVDVRLDIANGPVAVQNLDFLIGLDTSIAGVGQISQFPGVTAFPAGSAPSIWLEGTDSQGNPISIPATPPPGMMQGGPVYRVHCSNVFADTVVHLVVASIALNPPENGQPPKQLFAPRRPPKLIKIKGKYETVDSGVTESHTVEFSSEFK